MIYNHGIEGIIRCEYENVSWSFVPLNISSWDNQFSCWKGYIFSVFILKIFQHISNTFDVCSFPINQLSNQSICSINQSIQPINRPANQQFNKLLNQLINQQTSRSIIQQTNRSINQSTNQPINQQTYLSINKPTNQSTNQLINRQTNQSTNQPINQSIDKPTDQSITHTF